MFFHRLKPSEVNLEQITPRHYFLLLSALSEIHANAALFGGVRSESFKIKMKRLNSVAKKIFKSQ